MTTDIEKITYVPEGDSLIVLASDTTNWEEFCLTEAEVKYINQCRERNERTIYINQYTRWVAVYFAETSDKEHTNNDKARRAACNVCDRFNEQKVEVVTIANSQPQQSRFVAFAEGMVLSNYRFNKYFSKPETKNATLRRVRLMNEQFTDAQLRTFNALMEGVCRTRDLINEPFSELNSVQLGEAFRQMGSEAGFSVDVFSKEYIQSLKMGGLLAVNRGSKIDPTFSVMEWRPANYTNSKPVVLVGKGVVYDTGGYNVKTPYEHMVDMKSDMSGAAAVVGTLFAIAKANLPVHVIGLVPSTDNCINSEAFVPGDILTMYDGTTVEILNTDAEGRLILADALAYAKKYDPMVVVDLATLTGAAARAVGKLGIVGMGNSPQWIDELKTSGNNTYERIVEMPLWDEYKDFLKSSIADMTNLGGVSAGAITAGKFLEHFTAYPWVHLDIASNALFSSKESYWGVGGTGVGVRLLFDMLQRLAQQKTV